MIKLFSHGSVDQTLIKMIQMNITFSLFYLVLS